MNLEAQLVWLDVLKRFYGGLRLALLVFLAQWTLPRVGMGRSQCEIPAAIAWFLMAWWFFSTLGDCRVAVFACLRACATGGVVVSWFQSAYAVAVARRTVLWGSPCQGRLHRATVRCATCFPSDTSATVASPARGFAPTGGRARHQLAVAPETRLIRGVSPTS